MSGARGVIMKHLVVYGLKASRIGQPCFDTFKTLVVKNEKPRKCLFGYIELATCNQH